MKNSIIITLFILFIAGCNENGQEIIEPQDEIKEVAWVINMREYTNYDGNTLQTSQYPKLFWTAGYEPHLDTSIVLDTLNQSLIYPYIINLQVIMIHLQAII